MFLRTHDPTVVGDWFGLVWFGDCSTMCHMMIDDKTIRAGIQSPSLSGRGRSRRGEGRCVCVCVCVCV